MNGCCTTDFQKKVSEFISSDTCMVAKDNNNKRAIIVIAVEENEKGDNANTQVLAAGTEEKLVYAIAQFAIRNESRGLFNRAIKFLNFMKLSKIFGK